MKTVEYQNIELIYRFFEEVWNQGCEKAIDEMYVPEGTAHGLGDQFKRGPQQFKLLHRLIFETCSDAHAEVEDVMAAGDRVCMRGVVTMRHKSTGKKLRLEGGCYSRIEEGKIVEAWNGWDFIGVLIELGVLSENCLGDALQKKHNQPNKSGGVFCQPQRCISI